jgi:hypothetical protein
MTIRDPCGKSMIREPVRLDQGKWDDNDYAVNGLMAWCISHAS